MAEKRYLCLGDLHIRNDNLAILDRYFDKLKRHLEDEKEYDAIVVMGDTLHHHEVVYTPCLNKMYEYVYLLAEYTSRVFVLVGNHDMINHVQFLNTNHCLQGLKDRGNIIVVDTVLSYGDVIFAPFVPDGRFIEALQLSCGSDWKQAKCIFAHQSFDGAKMGAITLDGVEKWDPMYPQVVSGHIHDRQRPQDNIYYTGSSLQVAYGETKGKTVARVTVSDKGAHIQEIDLKPPSKETVYLTVTEARSYISKHVSEEDVSYKLSIKGDPEEIKVFKKGVEYKALLGLGLKMVFKTEKVIPVDEKDDSVPVNREAYRPFRNILQDMVAQDTDLKAIFDKVSDRNQIQLGGLPTQGRGLTTLGGLPTQGGSLITNTLQGPRKNLSTPHFGASLTHEAVIVLED
jgi:DNA repair exonuclease SbcCD nuclease subunit